MNKEVYNDGAYKIELQNDDFIVSEFEENQWTEMKRVQKYSEATKYIEGREQRKKSTKTKKGPLPCLYAPYGDKKYTPAKITSIAEPTRYESSVYYWVSKDGKRSKENAYSLYKDTEDNKNLFEEILNLKKQIETLEEKRKKLSDTEIKKHFGEDEK